MRLALLVTVSVPAARVRLVTQNATTGLEPAVEDVDAGAGVDAPLEVEFRSDMTVELVRASARDADVLFAARVSTQGEQSLEQLDADPARSKGLINYLMRVRHGRPFEHNSMTFYVQAPIFVFREFMRHRIASYNEESGRYRELDPVFYVPGPDRKLTQIGKPGHYDVRRRHAGAARARRGRDPSGSASRPTPPTSGCSMPGWPARSPGSCCR